MRRAYEAGRVSVDTCNHIGWTTQWVWVSVGLGRREQIRTCQLFMYFYYPVVGVLLLSGLIMLTKRRLTRGAPRGLSTVSGEDSDKDKLTVIIQSLLDQVM